MYFLLFSPVFAQSNLAETTPTGSPLFPLLHLTPLLSIASALFSPTAPSQPFSFQSIPHSFYRDGRVPPSRSIFTILSAPSPCLPRARCGGRRVLRGNQSKTLLFPAKHEFANPLFSARYTLFQVPYPVTPLFATLTKTMGVVCIASQNGSAVVLLASHPEKTAYLQQAYPSFSSTSFTSSAPEAILRGVSL
jgi:hypothetical protein